MAGLLTASITFWAAVPNNPSRAAASAHRLSQRDGGQRQLRERHHQCRGQFELERCDAREHPRRRWPRQGRRLVCHQVTPSRPLIRLTVQQSNCFVITSSGARIEGKLSAITGGSATQASSGPAQRSSRRITAAGHFMEPSVIIDNSSWAHGGAVEQPAQREAGRCWREDEAGSVVTADLFDIRSINWPSRNHQLALAWRLSGPGAAGGLEHRKARSHRGCVPRRLQLRWSSHHNYKAPGVKGGLGRGGQLKGRQAVREASAAAWGRPGRPSAFDGSRNREI